MLAFYNDYIRNPLFGMAYFYTAVTFMLASVVLLGEWKLQWRCLVRRLRDVLALILGWFLLCGLSYSVVPTMNWFSLVAEALLFVLYGALVQQNNVVEQAVRQIVFFACFVLTLRISESIGNYTDKLGWIINQLSMTDLVMLVSMMGVALYLRHFRGEDSRLMPKLYPVMMIVISVVAMASQLYNMLMINPSKASYDLTARNYNLFLALSFMVLLLLGYYMYYAIGREHRDKIELLAQQRRQELDEENMMVAQRTYEALKEVRHEIKNHTLYMKTLLEAEDYDKLRQYFERYQTKTAELVHYVNSGNRVVDAVVNNYVSRAKMYDIQLKTILAVPKQLPYRSEDVCSLLCNLLDNAIEGCAASGAEQKVITLSICPQMDYYMIRVENPVDTREVSARRRLTLQTTKKNPELHGFGTKIIRTIAEHYNGTVRFAMNGDLFVADVMLLDPQKGEIA